MTRHSFIFLIFFFTHFYLYTQVVNSNDVQWLVKIGGKSKFDDINNLNKYDNTISNCINIDSISFPAYTANSDSPKDDLFIIFSDGTYYTSRNNGNPAYLNQFKSPNTSNASYNSYAGIKTSKNIEYMYLTNLYEGDDPPKSIKVKQTTPPAVCTTFLGNRTLNSILSANHNIVKSKDVTIIINIKELKKCFGNNGPSLPTKFTLLFNDTYLDPSNIFNNIFSYWTGSNYLGSGRIEVSTSVDYHFINFRVSDNINLSNLPSLVFSIEGCNNSNLTETISDKFHDPNYVQVKCVYRKNNDYWVKYRVQCFNDGTANVDSVSFAMYMPALVDVNTIKVIDWTHGDSIGCGVTNKKFDLEKNTATNYVKFKFRNILDVVAGMPNPTIPPVADNIASVEFCIKIKSNQIKDVISGDLKPTLPCSVFSANGIGSETYFIRNFIDPCDSISGKDYCGRNIKKLCNCDCRKIPENISVGTRTQFKEVNKKYFFIGGGFGIAFIFAFFFFRFFRNRK